MDDLMDALDAARELRLLDADGTPSLAKLKRIELRDGTEFVVIGTDDEAQWTVVLRRAKGETAWVREFMQPADQSR